MVSRPRYLVSPVDSGPSLQRSRSSAPRGDTSARADRLDFAFDEVVAVECEREPAARLGGPVVVVVAEADLDRRLAADIARIDADRCPRLRGREPLRHVRVERCAVRRGPEAALDE